MKKIKLLIIVFTSIVFIRFALINMMEEFILVVQCLQKIYEQNDEENIVIEEKLTSETISTQSSDQKIENEEFINKIQIKESINFKDFYEICRCWFRYIRSIMALILSQDHEVILYEVDDRFGGHSNTIEVNYM
ncbi:MAG: hypothetical protein CM15mP109_09680 [Candidatus Dadabacteria bacterium]|nr:MAG: hypothetical protein CM15mP109_09680 [Candidatus Dadabacteria bacterium]